MKQIPTVLEGRAAEKAANYNAAMMEQEAAITRQMTRANVDAQRRRARQFMGTQRAAAAQSGVGFSGSVADILKQSATAAELDALNIEYQGSLAATGRKRQAVLTRWEGKQARRLANVKATIGIISGASNSYSPSGGGGGGGSFDSQSFFMG